MTSESPCPADTSLFAAATNDPSNDATERHLTECPICRRRVLILRAEMSALREIARDRPTES